MVMKIYLPRKIYTCLDFAEKIDTIIIDNIWSGVLIFN